MNAEEAISIVEHILSNERLNKLQATILQDTWNDLPYQETARKLGYELGYVKQTGSQLWRSLSIALGEKVSKTNLHTVIKRHRTLQTAHQPTVYPPVTTTPAATTPVRVPPEQAPVTDLRPLADWGEAADVSIFYGRSQELATLEHWILHDRCRLVGLFGMGGMGKTALSIKLAQQVTESVTHLAPFQFVIWRSLRNAPPIHSLMTDLILFFSRRQETTLPARLDQQMLRLLDYLRHYRCLLILDNAETVMQPGDRDGGYLPGYEGYGQLLRCVGETEHHSCLILTSREKPKGFAPREGETLPVRSLQLTGLPVMIGRELFQVKGQFSGTMADWQTLVSHYAGNPLALKIVATAIADFFDGSITRFLEFSQQGNSIFGDIRDLLARQIGRLSDRERQVMVWLAINREPTSFSTLQADCFPPVLPTQLLETLTALERRSLIEKRGTLFTLLPAVMEYITDWLIEQVCAEIHHRSNPISHRSASPSSKPHQAASTLRHYALIKTTAKDYIRETQLRLIVQPLLQRLLNRMEPTELDEQLMQLLAELRGKSTAAIGYSGGNVINLLCQLSTDLSHRDFSHLILWQAYLRKVPLHYTNLAASDLTNSVFTETLSQILCVTFSADGSLLAASDISYDVHVWRVADGKKMLTCKSQEGWVWAVAFSPTGTTLASSANGTIHLWDVETGECWQTLYNYTSRVFALAFSPDGRYLASGNENHQIHLWDVKTGHRVAVLDEHTDEVHAIAFSPNGCLLASGSYDRTVKVWEVSPPGIVTQAKLTLTGHTHWVQSVAFSPTGTTLASSSRDCTIKLWNLTTGNCQNTLMGHTQRISAIACAPYPTDPDDTPSQTYSQTYAPSPYLLVSGSDDQTVRLWNADGECIRVLQGHTSWVSSVAISPDGRVIASGSEDQSVRLWDSRTNHCLKVLQGYNSGVWSVAFRPDGRQLVSGGQDRIVRLWQVDGQPRAEPASQETITFHPFSGHTSWIWSVAYSPDGRAIASGSEDSTIRIWNVPASQPPDPIDQISELPREQHQLLTGHTHAVWSVAFSPDGVAIASGSLDGTIRLWDWQTGQCQQILREHRSGVWSVAFAPQHPQGKVNCHILASGSQDQTICLWEVQTDPRSRHLSVQPLKTLQEHVSWIRCIVFNPGGNLLASTSSDGTVKLWRVDTGECVQTWQAHNSLVLAAAFSPDGAILATGGGDGSVKLWEVASLLSSRHPAAIAPLRSLQGHEKWLRCLAYHPNGNLLASCSQDGAVKLWNWRSGICLDTLRLPRPYEGANITGITGLTEAQKDTLKLLGAIP